MIQDYFLTSKRLGFREWNYDDFALAKALWGNIKVTQLIDARGQLTDNQIREKLKNEITTACKSAIQYWPIFSLASGEFVGCCGLRPYPGRANTFETGFHICEDHWGKGFATEAALTVIDYAFQNYKVDALFAGHNPMNKASRNLLEKIGFIYTHDEFYEPTGLQHPSYLFIRDDYLAKHDK